ncbi:hypothetical protein EES43_17430 [Streptomyces sp. ADI96-02]|uniref:hypothetical protein n=1 Tax=Streptomyces sp. ADI96-02 TaxID=1522760 RepID=UPI000F5560D9|nr:hypothetical protein [Streptomyces sp. ADI96-02]RPK60268.1 hypothetical protein EES43_17430 [Streptomyces sp. ADI96-02]
MRTSTVRRAGTALAVTALMSAAACSGPGQGGGSRPDERAAGGAVDTASVTALQQVREKTGTARSARIEGTAEVGDSVALKQSGTIDWADGLTGSLTITYTGGTMGEALKRTGGDGSVRVRYLRDEYYAAMGDAFASELGGRSWIRYGLRDLAALGGAAGDVLKDQMHNSTPEQGVRALLASGDVEKVGREDVRGVSATHYSGTVDVAKLTARDSALNAEQLAAFKKQLAAAGVTTQTVDIWVDRDDLLVKKTERGRTAAGDFDTTVFYSDYGTEVSVEKPAASDTVDFRDVLKQQGGAAGAS